MKLPFGDYFLRLHLLEDANFAASSGTVTVDRPLQKHVFDDLPFIPNSSLRGVLRATASRENESQRKAIKEAFGGEFLNEQGESGKPGKLVVGNGELGSFPVLDVNGHRCRVFCSEFISKYLALVEPQFADEISLELKVVLQKNQILVFNRPVTLLLGATKHVKKAGESSQLIDLMQTLYGSAPAAEESWVVVHGDARRELWQQAMDIRDYTALDNQQGQAATGSLRSVQTIPQGTVFYSFCSYEAAANTVEFPSNLLQAGSSEATGLGFMKLGMIESKETITTIADVEGATIVSEEREAAIAVDVRQKIMEMKGNGREKVLLPKLRSLAKNFGERYHREGLEKSLAFVLAHAKPAKQFASAEEISTDIRVARSFLAILMDTKQQHIASKIDSWISATATGVQPDLTLRWLWMRRSLEVHGKEAGNA